MRENFELNSIKDTLSYSKIMKTMKPIFCRRTTVGPNYEKTLAKVGWSATESFSGNPGFNC